MGDTASRLTSERWPKLWKKEVVKIFKKGSLHEYNN